MKKKDLKKFNYHLNQLNKLAKDMEVPIVTPIFSIVQYCLITPGGGDTLVELASICTGYAKFTMAGEKRRAVKGTKTIQ